MQLVRAVIGPPKVKRRNAATLQRNECGQAPYEVAEVGTLSTVLDPKRDQCGAQPQTVRRPPKDGRPAAAVADKPTADEASCDITDAGVASSGGATQCVRMVPRRDIPVNEKAIVRSEFGICLTFELTGPLRRAGIWARLL